MKIKYGFLIYKVLMKYIRRITPWNAYEQLKTKCFIKLLFLLHRYIVLTLH